MSTTSLAGRRILVVEDEYFIADDLARQLKGAAAEVVGPVPSIGDALALIGTAGHLDGAILDVNLQGEMAFGVADELIKRNVPFIFATGYDEAAIPERYARVVRCEKPLRFELLAAALFG